MTTPVDPAATPPEPVPAGAAIPPGAGVTSETPPAAAPPVEEEPLTPELLEDEAIRGDFVLRWLVVVMALLFALTQIIETTALVHVKTGQYLASHGVLPPRTDVFSYTASDRPWVNLSWGFDLLLAGVYALGGWVGVSLVKPVLAAVAFGFAVHTLKPRVPTWWTSLCMALAVVACHKKFLATPYAVTFVGLAVVLWQLERWRQGREVSSDTTPAVKNTSLWALVPVFLVWANLDPRMFLGLYLLLLWGAGDLLATLFGVSSALRSEDRVQYWKVVGASVAVTLIHPFLWNTLLAPAAIFGVEYPGQQSYATAVSGGLVEGAVRAETFQPFFSILDVSPQHFDVGTWCALALLAIAFIAIALNYFREIGHLLVLAGFAALPVFAMNELQAAALVAGVIAGLNGQAWFASQFKLDYRVTTLNVGWSRGGRAVTVLAIAVITFFGGTGALRSAAVGRTGVGLDLNVQNPLTGLGEQLKDAYDNRPFNMSLLQGDILVWLDQKVFADSRAALFYGSGDKNLLRDHLRVRYALQGLPVPGGAKGSTPSNWKKILDAYKVTHVIPRLAGENPDYELIVRLISDPRVFQLTSFGGTSMQVYRADLKDPKLTKYLETHQVDFIKQYYSKEPKELEPRLAYPAPPDFYERYFWSRKRRVPLEILEAMHLSFFAYLGHPAGDAMAYLAIRRAQEGLAKDPDCAEGYYAMGLSYLTLLNNETIPQPNPLASKRPGSIRYYQAVVALNQALLADPDNHKPRPLLVDLYLGPVYRQARNEMLQMGRNEWPPGEYSLRPDLALREMETLYGIMSAIPNPDARTRNDRQSLVQQMKPLKDYVDRVKKQLAEKKADDPRSQAVLAGEYARAGCFNLALQVMNSDVNPVSNPYFKQDGMLPKVLLETGDAAQAYELMREYENPSLTPDAFQMASITAVSKSVLGEYALATEILESAAREVEKRGTQALLESLKLQPSRDIPWPMFTLLNAQTAFYPTPQAEGEMWLNAGLIHLEAGHHTRAEECLRKVLEVYPEAPYGLRFLVHHYVSQRLGKSLEISVLPDSELIPIIHEGDPIDP